MADSRYCNHSVLRQGRCNHSLRVPMATPMHRWNLGRFLGAGVAGDTLAVAVTLAPPLRWCRPTWGRWGGGRARRRRPRWSRGRGWRSGCCSRRRVASPRPAVRRRQIWTRPEVRQLHFGQLATYAKDNSSLCQSVWNWESLIVASSKSGWPFKRSGGI